MARPIDSILEAEKVQDVHVTAAQQAIFALSKERRKQFVAWLIAYVEIENAEKPRVRRVSPAPSKTTPGPTQPKVKNRDAILRVLQSGKALSTGDVFTAVKKIKPDAEYPSVAAEVARMRRDGLLVSRGRTTAGNYDLWGLAKAGGAQTAS
jgi:hypothetical protein